MTKTIDVFELPALTNAEMNAIKACWVGEASPHQQRQALNVVIDKLAMADRLQYQPGSFDETAFMNGRSFVGKAVRRVVKSKQKED